MQYKFLPCYITLGISITFNVFAGHTSPSSERDIVHGEKKDFGCDSLPSSGACYEQNQGKILGDIVLFGPNKHKQVPTDADGLPIPPQQDK